MKYRLAKEVQLVAQDGGGLLVRKYPLRTIRCNSSLWRLMCTSENGEDIVSSSPVLESLAEAGFLSRVWENPTFSECPRVSVIIPVKDRESELKRCLASLALLNYPREKLEIIVVDDGSSDNSAEVARRSGARCIVSGGVGAGPAAARNRGAHAARGVLLAFLDSDCTASPDWLVELIAPFAEPDIAAIGGLVRGCFTTSRIDRYENAMSSLFLGEKEKWGGAGDDSFYLPSCNLLVRKEYFLAVGGFDERMRVGEDVDLCYRLRDKGYRIGYLPFGTISHAHRNRAAAFMSRRFAYGTSEALLQEKHSKRSKKIQMSIFLLPVLILLPGLLAVPALACPIILALLLADVGWHCISMIRLPQRTPVYLVALARCRTLFSSGHYVSYHLIRYYLPLLAGISICNKNFAMITGLIFLWSAGVDYAVKRTGLGFPSFSLIYLLEQVAYSCGVFWGCFRRGSFVSYKVLFMFRPSIGKKTKVRMTAGNEPLSRKQIITIRS